MQFRAKKSEESLFMSDSILELLEALPVARQCIEPLGWTFAWRSSAMVPTMLCPCMRKFWHTWHTTPYRGQRNKGVSSLFSLWMALNAWAGWELVSLQQQNTAGRCWPRKWQLTGHEESTTANRHLCGGGACIAVCTIWTWCSCVRHKGRVPPGIKTTPIR